MSETSSTPESVKPPQLEQKQTSLLSEVRRIRRANKERLQKGELDKWPNYYGSDIKSYQEEFNRILRGEKIVDFVKNRPSPVVIDFMGPSDTIASLFKRLPKDKPKLGLAVSLEDRRSKRQVKRDEELNIQQVAGDITRPSTWQRINEALQGRKADLIMERAVLGLAHIPTNEKFYAIVINKAWQMLSDQNGMLLAQVLGRDKLYEYNIRIPQWIDLLKEKGVDAVYQKSNNFYTPGTFMFLIGQDPIFFPPGSIKMTKTPNSPKDLPFLKIT